VKSDEAQSQASCTNRAPRELPHHELQEEALIKVSVGAAPQRLAKSPTAKDGQQGTGPAVQRGIADHANGEAAKDGSTLTGIDKGIVDEVSGDTKKSSKTNVSSATTPDIAPAAASGLHGAATPAPGASGKQGGAGVEIDTRITPHQGRETIRGSKERVFKKTKTATLILEPVHNYHQGGPVRSDRSLRRNTARIFEQAYEYVPRQMPQYHSSRDVYGSYSRLANNNLNAGARRHLPAAILAPIRIPASGSI
jgi:hypothetical protein